MKKKLLFAVILSTIFFTCSKKDNPLGANANITQVDIEIGLNVDSITITGTGFTNYNQISGSINGVPISISPASSTTKIVAYVPAGTPTSGTITISSGGTPSTFPYDFNIGSESVTIGTTTITGSGGTLTLTGTFIGGLNGVTVTVNGMVFTITSSTSTQIIATNNTVTPSMLYGSQIKLGGVGQTISIGIPFVILNISPDSGVAGAQVKITGQGFSFNQSKDVVSFNGTPATIVSSTDASLTVTVPNGGTTGPVSISNGNSTFVGPVFTYPQQVSTFAGSSTAGAADGTGKNASFKSPENGVFDTKGNLFVADYGNNEIRKVDPQGVVTTFAGSTTAGFKDGNGTAARFSSPSGLAFDAQGNLYVSDELNNRIRKIDPQGNVTTIAGTGNAAYADGIGTLASFQRPIGIGIDNVGGNLYVADSRNNMIREINISTTAVTTIAGTSGFFGAQDGSGYLATFNSPRGICVYSMPGGQGVIIFIADYTNNKIRKLVQINNTVLVSTVGGDPSGKPGFTTSPPTFNSPNSVALGFAKDGVTPELFIADASNHAIRYVQGFDPVSSTPPSIVQTLAGTGTSGLTNGNYANAQFYFPDGVVFNPSDGNLYVIEFGNNDIRKIILQ